MKNFLLSKCKTTLKNIPAMRIVVIASLLFASSQLDLLHAQAKLSVQGILKKSSGDAVPDGSYTITFRLYTNPNATVNQNVWIETQDGVDVSSGIYSTVLGNVTPLNVPFDVEYYLGVAFGGNNATEMTPRITLTSAPYALSLRGSSNFFPSTGQVVADSIDVNGNVLAKMGAPGPNGSLRQGYGFLGEKDSGMFTTGVSRVSLYVNNQEEVLVTQDSVEINGKVRAENLVFDAGGKINYNGNNDWRLVETDYFETVSNAEGWKVYNPYSPPPPNGIINAWSNGTGVGATVTNFSDDFAGRALMPSTAGQVFKKQFTLPGGSTAGTYTYVKVVFNYYFLNTWGTEVESERIDMGWAGFSKVENCSDLSLGWFSGPTNYASAGHGMFEGSGQFGGVTSFVGTNYSDQWRTEEMVARYPSGAANPNFYVIFGFATNQGIDDENFAVGHIEVWVK